MGSMDFGFHVTCHYDACRVRWSVSLKHLYVVDGCVCHAREHLAPAMAPAGSSAVAGTGAGSAHGSAVGTAQQPCFPAKALLSVECPRTR